MSPFGKMIPADPRLKNPCHDHGVLSRIHRKTLAARQGWRSTGSLVAFGKEAHERQADRKESPRKMDPLRPSGAGVPVGHTCRGRTRDVPELRC